MRRFLVAALAACAAFSVAAVVLLGVQANTEPASASHGGGIERGQDSGYGENAGINVQCDWGVTDNVVIYEGQSSYWDSKCGHDTDQIYVAYDAEIWCHRPVRPYDIFKAFDAQGWHKITDLDHYYGCFLTRD